MADVKFSYKYDVNGFKGINRYESDVMVKGYSIAKFICTKYYEGRKFVGWVVRVHDSENGTYEYAAWSPDTVWKTAKESIEAFNSMIVNPVNCDRWSVGWIEEDDPKEVTE